MIYGVISSLKSNKNDHSIFLVFTLIGLYPHYMIPFVLSVTLLDYHFNDKDK
jgi:hypothetical protein